MPEKYADSLVTAPSVEPITLHEAKRACDEDDNYRDAEFERWITEARQIVEHDSRKAFINQTRRLVLHSFPSTDSLELLSVSPLSSVTSVTYLDTAGASQTLSTDVYKVDTDRTPGVLWLKKSQSWPDTYDEANAVTITYVAGYGAAATDVPVMAKQAMLYVVRQRLERPDMLDASQLYSVDETYAGLIYRLQEGVYP